MLCLPLCRSTSSLLDLLARKPDGASSVPEMSYDRGSSDQYPDSDTYNFKYEHQERGILDLCED